MHRKVKFRVSVKELAFEYEGDMEMGQRLQKGIQASLSHIIETPNRILPAPEVVNAEALENGSRDSTHSGENGHRESPRAARKQSRPKGTSAAARIKVLCGDGFFREERSLADVQESLAQSGYKFEAKEVSAAILQVLRKELLDRRKSENGNYVYFNKATGNGQSGNGSSAEGPA
jgi:hypothetical protein